MLTLLRLVQLLYELVSHIRDTWLLQAPPTRVDSCGRGALASGSRTYIEIPIINDYFRVLT